VGERRYGQAPIDTSKEKNKNARIDARRFSLTFASESIARMARALTRTRETLMALMMEIGALVMSLES
jgi:hypothetical protein